MLTVRRVLGQLDLALVEDVVERRPAAARVKLCVRREQWLAAHDARVHAQFAVLVEFASKGPEKPKSINFQSNIQSKIYLKPKFSQKGNNKD
jgi:hypothetical protein